MNKRKAKKAAKKVVYPLVDEMNLLTLSPEEYNEAMDDFHKWVQKHCRFKHYRDKYKRMGFFSYHFPVGEAHMQHMESVLKSVRKRNVVIVAQDINKFLNHPLKNLKEE